MTPPSPPVTDSSWGRIVVAGERAYKDVKLFPGGSREWDWGETGTRHRPGIQPADVEELVDRGARVVVLSTGRLEQLGVTDETLRFLGQRGIEVHRHPTADAIALYNELRERTAVGALIHTTC